MSAYGIFANYYDLLTADVDYAGMCDYICSKIRTKGILVDVACGTGQMAIALAKRGYEVIGIDASPLMLSQATAKAHNSGADILFLNQQMADIDLYGTADVFISTLDSLNHLSNQLQLSQVFHKVSLFLNPGGYFIFDVNTLYKHQYVLADNAYIYDCGEFFCAWQNEYREKNSSVDITLDFFVKDGTKYRRESECFTEVYFSHETILSSLEQNGLKLLDITDDYSGKQPGEKTQRITYVAAKE